MPRRGKFVLASYSQIYFSDNWLSGLLFAAATFIVPEHGFAGLMGLLLANFWAYKLGQSSASIASGFFGLNGLLSGLTLGLYFEFTWVFLLLLVLVTFWCVVIAIASRDAADRYFGIPILSLPFVLASWLALMATLRFGKVSWTLKTVDAWTYGADWLPDSIAIYIKSVGATFFQLSVPAGLMIATGLLIASRWSFLLSIIGFLAGALTYVALGGFVTDIESNFIGFNFILTAIAVGGIWTVISPMSIVFGAIAAAGSAILCASLISLFETWSLPILALPFIVSTQVLLYVYNARHREIGIKVNKGKLDSPENTVARVKFLAQRYPDPLLPATQIPVLGNWKITQGFDGEHTHQGLWRFAWDFEAVNADGETFRGQGNKLTDYYGYDAPVVAPANGTVVRVIDSIADNPVGEVNVQENWGNLVIIQHDLGLYSSLCHLKKDSVLVKQGEQVVEGQIIAKLGSSGRSPVPHLHFQFQASPDVGSATLKGQLLHYVDSTAQPNYRSFGTPQKDTILHRVDSKDEIRRAINLAPGREWIWDVTRGTKTTLSTWQSTIDFVGNRSIKSEKANAGIYVDSHYATQSSFAGDVSDVLACFYLGNTRIPYTADPLLIWQDNLDARPFLDPIRRLAFDLALPFVTPTTISTVSRLEKIDHGCKIITKISTASGWVSKNKLPTTIETTFLEGLGPTKIVAKNDTTTIISAEIQHEI